MIEYSGGGLLNMTSLAHSTSTKFDNETILVILFSRRRPSCRGPESRGQRCVMLPVLIAIGTPCRAARGFHSSVRSIEQELPQSDSRSDLELLSRCWVCRRRVCWSAFDDRILLSFVGPANDGQAGFGVTGVPAQKCGLSALCFVALPAFACMQSACSKRQARKCVHCCGEANLVYEATIWGIPASKRQDSAAP